MLRDIVSNAALDLMRMILTQECAVRRVPAHGPDAEKLACVIMTAYLDGVTDPAELRTIAQGADLNDGSAGQIGR